MVILRLRIFLTQPLQCGITRLAFLYISCLFCCFDKIQLGSLGWPGSLHKSQVGFALMRTSCLGFHRARVQVSLFLPSLAPFPGLKDAAGKQRSGCVSLKLLPLRPLPVALANGSAVIRLGNPLHSITDRGLAGLALGIFLQYSVIVAVKPRRLEQVPSS